MHRSFDKIEKDLSLETKRTMTAFDWYRLGCLHERKALLKLVEEYESYNNGYHDCKTLFTRPAWLQDILNEHT